ncbi:MAG: BspA family leucine-rich repeat surface protein, partial [Clostridia bacterium]|nr:BspA family leucine-rich repeat surface protein [Clostridia bacterium]
IYDSNENEIERDAQDYVVFNANDNTSEKDVYIGEVNLNPYASKAYFYFTIESLMDSGYIRVLCTPTYNEDRKNIDADIAYCNIDEHTGFDATQSASTIAEDDWTKAHYNNIPAGGYKMIRVELSVHDVNKTAKCGGTFDIQLDYSTVTGLEALDDTTKSTIQSNTTAEQIIFAYAEEQPEGAAQTSAAKPMADTTKKIWTKLDGTTLYVYSNYTIDLPADCTRFFANRTTLKTLDLTNFNTSNVTKMEKMFMSCSALTNLNLSTFDTSSVTTMEDMFYLCSSLKTLDVSNFNTSNVTNMLGVFSDCTALTQLNVSSFDTSNVTNMEYMFFNCTALTKLDLSTFNTASVKSMSLLVGDCESLESLDLTNFDTSSVTSMWGMFQNCKKLTKVDVSGFDTSQVTDMSFMFANCYELKSLDVSNFDTRNVTTMNTMFQFCENLISIDVSGWDTEKLTNMSFMFNKCVALEGIDVSKWNTSSVTDMRHMFNGCDSLTSLDLSNFNTSLVQTMCRMFRNCSRLEKIYVGDGWTMPALVSSHACSLCGTVAGGYQMFVGCSKLVGAISYSSSKIDSTYANCESGYFTYKAPKSAA